MNSSLLSHRRLSLPLTLFAGVLIGTVIGGCQPAKQTTPRTTAQMKGNGPPIPGSQQYAPQTPAAQPPAGTTR
jgi:hypothetical protein